MAAYQYQALNKQGFNSKGLIEADSERHARQLLRDRGLIPVHLRGLARQKSGSFKSTIHATELSLFTRQLATLIAAGIPVEEALNGVREQTDKDSLRALSIGLRSKILEGYGLAQAMALYPNTFPELYRATVGSGEQTGKLDVVLEQLADYTESQQKTRQKIQQALIYPLLMIVVSVSIIAFLLTFVVPKIIDVFTSSGQTLPLMTLVLIRCSNFAKANGLYLILAFLILSLGFRKSLGHPKIRAAWHKVLLKLPMISYLIRATHAARYLHTFSILFSAGISVLETMRVASSLMTNSIIREALDAARLKVREGTGIHTALKESRFISPMAVHLIASGEKSGQLAEMMDRSASHLDSEVQGLIDTTLTLLEPIVILMLGAVVLFIVLATLLPIFSMEQLIA